MTQSDGKRRSFLKQLLAGTAAMVGTAAVVKSAKASSAKSGPVQSAGGAGETLYRETEDFRKYYKSLRS